MTDKNAKVCISSACCYIIKLVIQCFPTNKYKRQRQVLGIQKAIQFYTSTNRQFALVFYVTKIKACIYMSVKFGKGTGVTTLYVALETNMSGPARFRDMVQDWFGYGHLYWILLFISAESAPRFGKAK